MEVAQLFEHLFFVKSLGMVFIVAEVHEFIYLELTPLVTHVTHVEALQAGGEMLVTVVEEEE